MREYLSLLGGRRVSKSITETAESLLIETEIINDV